MDKQNKIIIAVAVVVIALIAVFAIFKSAGGLNGNGGNKITSTTSSNFFEGEQSLEKLAEVSSCPLTADKDAFAKCLTSKGLTMYGAAWCSHCQAQKALFEDSFRYVSYVECPDNTNLCLAKGVQGYPTWILEPSTSTATTTSVVK